MKTTLLATMISFALAGCASIFNGQTQAVQIKSEPEGATISITNRAGEKVHTGTTPATVTLNRGAGYFKSESYTIAFSKTGFATKLLTVSGSMSGWYIGNLLFGGVIGMLAVDPVTGAMYNLPDSVNETLDSEAPKTSRSNETLTIVSTDSLSRAQMQTARLLGAIN